MKSTVVTCDRCGKDISPDKSLYGHRSHIQFTLEYWHGGSMGGEEDRDHFNLDLCESCSRVLSMRLKEWLKNKK